MSEFQLRSYEIPVEGMDERTFVETVQRAFDIWNGLSVEEKKQVKFFSGESNDGQTFKVFALIPLKMGQTLNVEWSDGEPLDLESRMATNFMKVTLKEDIRITQEIPNPDPKTPLAIA